MQQTSGTHGLMQGRRSGASNRNGVAWWLTFVLAGLLLVLPLFLVEMPPLEDYPAHLARMYALAFGAQDPFLSQMYAPSWHIIRTSRWI